MLNRIPKAMIRRSNVRNAPVTPRNARSNDRNAQTPMLMPCNQFTERPLGEAEVLTAGRDGSVHLLTKLLVAVILWEVELCDGMLALNMILREHGQNLRLKQVWLVGNLSLLE